MRSCQSLCLQYQLKRDLGQEDLSTITSSITSLVIKGHNQKIPSHPSLYLIGSLLRLSEALKDLHQGIGCDCTKASLLPGLSLVGWYKYFMHQG